MNVLPEGRWFLSNYLLMNAVGFIVGVMWGIARVLDGDLLGEHGALPEAVLWFAVGFVAYLPLVLGIPVLALGLIMWRTLMRVVPHPRAAAFIVAGGVAALAMLIPRTDPRTVLAFVVVPLLAYAAIVRLPPGLPEGAGARSLDSRPASGTQE